MLKELFTSGAFIGAFCGLYGFLTVYCGLLVRIYTGSWILAWLTVVTMVCPFTISFYYIVSRRNRRTFEGMMKPLIVDSERQEQALKDFIENVEKKERVQDTEGS